MRYGRWMEVVSALATTTMLASASMAGGVANRQRLVVLTDIGNEPDDSESMVRLLLYSNDIDIEALVAATSRHLPSTPRPDLITQRVDAYAGVLGNLRVHDPHYPDADRLRSVIRVGSPVYGMSGVGRGKDSAASRAIIAAVDKPDPRPVWVAVWGGAADLAQALWTVRATRSPAAVDRFVSRIRVYSISDQDDAGPWARAYFPKLFWEVSIHGFTRYQLGTWTGISTPQPGASQDSVSMAWLRENIHSKGPLGALYPLPVYAMEGDTPSFLSLIPNGLSVPERPDWGGWGGRYDRLSDGLGLWTNTSDRIEGVDGKSYFTPQATIWRWRSAYQNDFAARMLWSVTPDLRGANHAPMAMLNGKAGMAPVEIQACPGTPVTLSAAGSSDPDGNPLSYKWMWYREASGLFAPNVQLSATEGESITVHIGNASPVDQFTPPRSYGLHVVLAVTDNGTPAMTRYRRAIMTVPGAPSAAGAPACSVKPIPPHHAQQ
ncbi:DUF1593 domain-containing protein [Sphingobium sufflavum]|uniref:nucleoside hydrolase-like domain-containing protein n=1 Tax=Sphingobium sufflavum TaxID=1129547 RepID=UPI001F4430A8|nr:nucleoside hydrolase-like domain-containing protein [Sphingobium sufflavum]MCE7798854.1 DUF1593 domain-containing protein [Sphingobium sufflavum]